jgi:hypothetical protein
VSEFWECLVCRTAHGLLTDNNHLFVVYTQMGASQPACFDQYTSNPAQGKAPGNVCELVYVRVLCGSAQCLLLNGVEC